MSILSLSIWPKSSMPKEQFCSGLTSFIEALSWRRSPYSWHPHWFSTSNTNAQIGWLSHIYLRGRVVLHTYCLPIFFIHRNSPYVPDRTKDEKRRAARDYLSTQREEIGAKRWGLAGLSDGSGARAMRWSISMLAAGRGRRWFRYRPCWHFVLLCSACAALLCSALEIDWLIVQGLSI